MYDIYQQSALGVKKCKVNSRELSFFTKRCNISIDNLVVM